MVQLTKEGYKKLKQELKQLQNEEKPKVAKALEEAIAEGDLSENAAYEEAKEKQAKLEAKISELKQKLSTAEIVEEETGGTAGVGSTIRVKDENGSEKTFKITDSEESNPMEGKISYDSPLGKAFIGHQEGEKVKANTPGGEKQFEVLEVK